MTVSQMKKGESRIVSRLTCNAGGRAIRQRLLDMGILPHVRLQVQRFAPAGGVVWVEANGTHIALRRDEAEMVEVTA